MLNAISKGRRRGALLGYINALRENEKEIHRSVGDIIIECGGVDFLVTVGQITAEIAKRVSELDSNCEIYTFHNTDGVYELLKNVLNEDTIILVKYAGYHYQGMIDLKNKLRGVK